MDKNKLKKIEQHLVKELLSDLPVGFNNLEYVEIQEDSIPLKLLSIPKYITEFYVASQHHKPISKCLSDFNE